MSSYPPPPRRLERSSNDRVIAGVCSGVAHYVNLDPTLVRVLTAVLTVVTGGTPVLLYLVAYFLMPEERRFGPPPHVPGQPGPTPPPPAPGPWPRPSAGNDPIWGSEGAPWEQPRASAPPTPPARPSAPAAPSAPEAPVASAEPADPADPAAPVSG